MLKPMETDRRTEKREEDESDSYDTNRRGGDKIEYLRPRLEALRDELRDKNRFADITEKLENILSTVLDKKEYGNCLSKDSRGMESHEDALEKGTDFERKTKHIGDNDDSVDDCIVRDNFKNAEYIKEHNEQEKEQDIFFSPEYITYTLNINKPDNNEKQIGFESENEQSSLKENGLEASSTYEIKMVKSKISNKSLHDDKKHSFDGHDIEISSEEIPTFPTEISEREENTDGKKQFEIHEEGDNSPNEFQIMREEENLKNSTLGNDLQREAATPNSLCEHVLSNKREISTEKEDCIIYKNNELTPECIGETKLGESTGNDSFVEDRVGADNCSTEETFNRLNENSLDNEIFYDFEEIEVFLEDDKYFSSSDGECEEFDETENEVSSQFQVTARFKEYLKNDSKSMEAAVIDEELQRSSTVAMEMFNIEDFYNNCSDCLEKDVILTPEVNICRDGIVGILEQRENTICVNSIFGQQDSLDEAALMHVKRLGIDTNSSSVQSAKNAECCQSIDLILSCKSSQTFQPDNDNIETPIKGSKETNYINAGGQMLFHNREQCTDRYDFMSNKENNNDLQNLVYSEIKHSYCTDLIHDDTQKLYEKTISFSEIFPKDTKYPQDQKNDCIRQQLYASDNFTVTQHFPRSKYLQKIQKTGCSLENQEHDLDGSAVNKENITSLACKVTSEESSQCSFELLELTLNNSRQERALNEAIDGSNDLYIGIFASKNAITKRILHKWTRHVQQPQPDGGKVLRTLSGDLMKVKDSRKLDVLGPTRCVGYHPEPCVWTVDWMSKQTDLKQSEASFHQLRTFPATLMFSWTIYLSRIIERNVPFATIPCVSVIVIEESVSLQVKELLNKERHSFKSTTTCRQKNNFQDNAQEKNLPLYSVYTFSHLSCETDSPTEYPSILASLGNSEVLSDHSDSENAFTLAIKEPDSKRPPFGKGLEGDCKTQRQFGNDNNLKQECSQIKDSSKIWAHISEKQMKNGGEYESLIRESIIVRDKECNSKDTHLIFASEFLIYTKTRESSNKRNVSCNETSEECNKCSHDLLRWILNNPSLMFSWAIDLVRIIERNAPFTTILLVSQIVIDESYNSQIEELLNKETYPMRSLSTWMELNGFQDKDPEKTFSHYSICIFYHMECKTAFPTGGPSILATDGNNKILSDLPCFTYSDSGNGFTLAIPWPESLMEPKGPPICKEGEGICKISGCFGNDYHHMPECIKQSQNKVSTEICPHINEKSMNNDGDYETQKWKPIIVSGMEYNSKDTSLTFPAESLTNSKTREPAYVENVFCKGTSEEYSKSSHELLRWVFKTAYQGHTSNEGVEEVKDLNKLAVDLQDASTKRLLYERKCLSQFAGDSIKVQDGCKVGGSDTTQIARYHLDPRVLTVAFGSMKTDFGQKQTAIFKFHRFPATLMFGWTIEILRFIARNTLYTTSSWVNIIEIDESFRSKLKGMLTSGKHAEDTTNSLGKINDKDSEKSFHLYSINPFHSWACETAFSTERPSLLTAVGNNVDLFDIFDITFSGSKNGLTLAKSRQKSMGEPEIPTFGKEAEGDWKENGHFGDGNHLKPEFNQLSQIKDRADVEFFLQCNGVGHSIHVNISSEDNVRTLVQVGEDNTILQTTELSHCIDDTQKDGLSTHLLGNQRESEKKRHAFEYDTNDYNQFGQPKLEESSINVQLMHMESGSKSRTLVYILHMELQNQGLLIKEWTEKATDVHMMDSAALHSDCRTVYLKFGGNSPRKKSTIFVQVGMRNKVVVKQQVMANLRERIWLIPWEFRSRYSLPDESPTLKAGCWNLGITGEYNLARPDNFSPNETRYWSVARSLGCRNQQYLMLNLKLTSEPRRSLLEIASQKADSGYVCSCLKNSYVSRASDQGLDEMEGTFENLEQKHAKLGFSGQKQSHFRPVNRLCNRCKSVDPENNAIIHFDFQSTIRSDTSGLFCNNLCCSECQNMGTFSAQSASCVGCSPSQDVRRASNSSNRTFENKRSAVYLDLLDRATKLIVEVLLSSDSFDKLLDFLGLQVYHVGESGTIVFSSDNLVEVIDKLKDTERDIHELLFVILEGLEIADGICIDNLASFTCEFKIRTSSLGEQNVSSTA